VEEGSRLRQSLHYLVDSAGARALERELMKLATEEAMT
jgi:hypothetical protein